MKIGFIGLGKMGAGMVERLLEYKHEIAVFDLNEDAVAQTKKKGAIGTTSLEELVKTLDKPRIIWLMLPAGRPTEMSVSFLGRLLEKGDILIDGGNSFYKDSMKRAEELAAKGVFFLDVGTSGGVAGREIGYCLMVGGDLEAYKKAEPVFESLAPKGGCAYVGKRGAGHFVKMVHNGIEYGMLEAYAEGFEILQAKREFNFNLAGLSKLWNRGSVIRSWILKLAGMIFKEEPDLASIRGYVEDSGEGRWTILEALEQNVPAPVITASLLQRLRSRQDESFSAKIIAALRNKFGGHNVESE